MSSRSLATAQASSSSSSSSSPPPPPASSSSTAADPKLSAIVDSIEKLTLLEAADLVGQLKVSKLDLVGSLDLEMDSQLCY